MKKAPYLVALALVSVVLAGCSPTATTTAPIAKKTLTAQTAKPTGDIDTVQWGSPGSEPPSLDWIYSWDYGSANQVLANLCEGLVRQNPDGTTSPNLATAVSRPDPTTYEIRVRSGVKFTDGKPMTAEDVAYSLSRHLVAKPASYWGLWYANVASVEATGSDTVTVKLKAPDSLFGQVLSTPAGYVGEKAYIESKGAQYGTVAGGVMCTGPFSLKTWSKGQSVTLARNDAYWNTALRARAKEVRINFIPDPSALNSALATGEVDGASGVVVSSLKALSGAKSGKLYLNRGTEVVVLQLNDLTAGPLKDVRIRRALRAVIDYDGITKGVLGGYAEPAKSFTPPSTWGASASAYRAADAGLEGGRQDLPGAKKLIEAAGGAPAEPIVLAVNSEDTSVVSVATAVQASAASVGLKVKIRKFPASEFSNLFFDPAARAGVNAMLSNVTVDVLDPLELLYQVIPGSPYDFTKLNDQKLKDVLTKAVRSDDPKERARYTTEANAIINRGVYSISLYSIDARLFLNTTVTGSPVSTLSQWYSPWAATLGAP